MIVLAIGDGAFNSTLSAGGGGGGGSATGVKWIGTWVVTRAQVYEASSNGSGWWATLQCKRVLSRVSVDGDAGMQDLGDFGYAYAAAYGVSSDGRS